jgi:hypothetical protein
MIIRASQGDEQLAETLPALPKSYQVRVTRLSLKLSGLLRLFYNSIYTTVSLVNKLFDISGDPGRLLS